MDLLLKYLLQSEKELDLFIYYYIYLLNFIWTNNLDLTVIVDN